MDVLGISPDSPAALKRFDEKYSLGFQLLSDPDHTVATAYGVWGKKSMYGKTVFGMIRSSFLIDGAGKIIDAWYKIAPEDTVPKAMQVLSS